MEQGFWVVPQKNMIFIKNKENNYAFKNEKLKTSFLALLTFPKVMFFV